MSNIELKQLYQLSVEHCIICYLETGKVRNKTLYWHLEEKDSKGSGIGMWCYCNRCERGYSIEEYAYRSGLSLIELLKQDFNFKETKTDEVNALYWPKSFVFLDDEVAKPGVEYLNKRGLKPIDNIHYDTWRNGIVFPYYYDKTFCGAQIRLIEPWIDSDGVERKIDTMPGTRLSLLWFNWNGVSLLPHIKAVIVTEGAINTLSIQQALNSVFGRLSPYLCIAASGSGASAYHRDSLTKLKEKGIKVIAAPDSDEAGLKMLGKLNSANAITHYALTGDDELDWNDKLIELGDIAFAEWFLKEVKTVE